MNVTLLYFQIFSFSWYLSGAMLDQDYLGDIVWSPLPGPAPAAAEIVPGKLFRTFYLGEGGVVLNYAIGSFSGPNKYRFYCLNTLLIKSIVFSFCGRAN